MQSSGDISISVEGVVESPDCLLQIGCRPAVFIFCRNEVRMKRIVKVPPFLVEKSSLPVEFIPKSGSRKRCEDVVVDQMYITFQQEPEHRLGADLVLAGKPEHDACPHPDRALTKNFDRFLVAFR